MNDTEPEIETRFHELLMSRSGEERFMMAVHSFEAARSLVLASLRPDLSENELKQTLFERVYGASVEDFLSGKVTDTYPTR